MQDNPFKVRTPNIAENSRLREPQQGAYAALSAFAANPGAEEREVGIVLPVVSLLRPLHLKRPELW